MKSAKWLICCLFLLPGPVLRAQLPVSVGMAGGFAFYHGDLARFYQSGVGPAAGTFARYSFEFPFSFRVSVLRGTVTSNDKIRPERKLNFRSPVTEVSLQIEYYITRPKSGFRNYSIKYGRRKYHVYTFPVLTYVYTGIGRFSFNPKGRYPDGTWKPLQPLCTEGQGVFPTREAPYKLSSLVIPVGVGMIFPMRDAFQFGFEIGVRKTFTDYLDDVSLTYVNTGVLESAKGPLAAYFADPSHNLELTTTSPATARGNPKNKDAYIFAFVTLQYDFGKIKKKKTFRI